MLCEAAICYTGDILDPDRPKYDLKYYVDLAKELEKLGANLLAIKDMAGLCKPYAAQLLVRTLKQEIGIPIHFHTHDSAGGQIASLLLAAEEGVDIVDAAMAPFSGMTSQPNLNTLVEALRFTPRDTGLDVRARWQTTADYWEAVRQLLPALRDRPAGGQRRRLSPRDAGRPVHQPVPAGAGAGPGATAGTKSAGCTPRSTACSATSSR